MKFTMLSDSEMNKYQIIVIIMISSFEAQPENGVADEIKCVVGYHNAGRCLIEFLE